MQGALSQSRDKEEGAVQLFVGQAQVEATMHSATSALVIHPHGAVGGLGAIGARDARERHHPAAQHGAR